MSNNLTEWIAECNESGWLINNLFQLDFNVWQANLRSTDNRFTEFGRGDNPINALFNAMTKIDSAEQAEGDDGQAKVYSGKLAIGRETLDISALINAHRKPMEDRRF